MTLVREAYNETSRIQFTTEEEANGYAANNWSFSVRQVALVIWYTDEYPTEPNIEVV